ncbi:hypothetical protein JYT89_01685 [Flavobacteriaceae bacterium AH-315-B10]|nr:hypothetical protein [Flavobacteriaceae bacterium AH-315-B10]
MKKIFLFLMLLCAFTMSAQLNSNAQLIKDKLPKKYDLIKLLASEDWEDDHEMMLYIINNQSDSFIKVLGFEKTSNYDESILVKAISEWSKVIKGKNCIDWSMVVYTYNNQLEAKGKY